MSVSRVVSSFILVLLVPLLSRSPASALNTNDSEPFEGIAGVYAEYFPVEGNTPAEVRKYLTEHGTPGADGGRYDAYTEWHIYWNWPVNGHVPDIQNVKVTSSIIVHLPEWQCDLPPSDPARRSWEKYMAALRKHEAGHAYQALYHKGQIELALKEAAESDPDLTAKQANRIAHRIIRKAQQTDEEYDRITVHGALQGAKWP